MFRRSPRLSSSIIAVAAALTTARVARAEDPVPLVHPLYVHLPDAPEDDALRRAFTEAAGRYRLHPVEVVDVPTPPAPRAPEWLRAGVLNTQKIAFGEALHDLDAAAVEVSTTGGAGLSTDELSDLYLNRAIATAHADWNATADAPPTDARTRAYADYLRAATIYAGFQFVFRSRDRGDTWQKISPDLTDNSPARMLPKSCERRWPSVRPAQPRSERSGSSTAWASRCPLKPWSNWPRG